MGLSRQIKRKHKLPLPLNTQFFSSENREIAKKLEEGFIAVGELKGIATAEEIFRERFIEEIPNIKGIGKYLQSEIAKALGLVFTEEEIKRMEQKK